MTEVGLAPEAATKRVDDAVTNTGLAKLSFQLLDATQNASACDNQVCGITVFSYLVKNSW